MNISPKRMAQAEEQVGDGASFSSLLETLLDAFHDEWQHGYEANEFRNFLATDPTPAAMTVADLSEEDRLGYALSKKMVKTADKWYLLDRDGNCCEQNRTFYNEIAAAVATEMRAVMRERGDVIVPGDRDEDADIIQFHRAYYGDGYPDSLTERWKLGIRAVIAHHAEREVQP